VKIATAAQMRELDRRASAEFAIPSLLLMENAGAETAREILAAYPRAGRGRVLILCGRGNNGGDGFVVARRLLAEGAEVRTLLLGRRPEVKGDAATNLEILTRLGGPPQEVLGPEDLSIVLAGLAWADLVVDALLGTGARGAAEGLTAEVIQAVNRAGRPVAAVDLPSGLGADSPIPPGPAIQAALTVTFALPKPSLLLYPAAAAAGRVRVVDIGIPRKLREAGLPLGLLERADVAPAFPARDPAGHKGTYGHVLVIAGSAGKTGAAALASRAALRAGAGLVTLAVPASLQDVLAAKLTEVMTEALPETETRAPSFEARGRLHTLAEGKTAVAIGPGLGRHPSTVKLVQSLLAELPLPIVLDADGITAFGGQAARLRNVPGQLILTPHPGEMATLLAVARDGLLADRLRLVPETAAQLGLTLVLKLARTVIGLPTGEGWIVPTGNPGMATGGTGDALTGLIAGLLARGVTPALAAQAGAYLHGLAGDLAAARRGPEAMLAGDLLAEIPDAIRRVKADATALGQFPAPDFPGSRGA